MNHMARSAAIAVLIALLPVGAAAASPSPSLSTLLAAPPSGFAEATSAAFHGSFTAHDYAVNADSTKAAAIEATLGHDGFVAGYGKTWVSSSTGHGLIEAVLAFTGGRGAHDWLSAAETGDKADPTYKHADTANGLGTYYGGHFVTPSANGSVVGDVFSFIKGNDVWIVGTFSPRDDVQSLATTQAAAQYKAAPAETIPSSQWPENQSSSTSGSGVGGLIADLIIAVLILGVVAVAVVLVRRSRRSSAAMAGSPAAGGPDPGIPAATIPAATIPYNEPYSAAAAIDPQPAQAPAPAGLEMSPDGNFWWDGGAWRDASLEAPPHALRSPDSAYWWDGRSWRPVPQRPV